MISSKSSYSSKSKEFGKNDDSFPIPNRSPMSYTPSDNSNVVLKPVKSSKSSSVREGFGNRFEFILTCLGLSVSLGNIWRFPTRAYSNGGSAFLIPYITCGILFGLPAIYLEFIVGQYQSASPPLVFRRIMPILEGVGWMSTVVSATVSIYFLAITAWISIYIVNIFRGHMNLLNKCTNPWNDRETCINMLDQKRCFGRLAPGLDPSHPRPSQMVFLNGKCLDASNFRNLTTATEQYFKYFIINPSMGMFDITNINWPILIGMTVCWLITALLILKGVKLMGKISYITVGLPYILIIILAIRGITLDGASEGLHYYLGRPNFNKLLSFKTWTEALKQLCFSLALGYGGLMSMASYSDKNNSCYRNAIILLIGDTSMSLIGGVAVFSILGFLAKQRGVEVPDVVESGLSLAFVVYPEAMAQLWFPSFWMFLFFSMLFLLAISSDMAMVEVFCSCIYDQMPALRKKKWLVVSIWCLFLYSCGLVFTTNAGFYWFQMYDEYAGGFSSVITTLIEIIVLMWIYGSNNFKDDLKEMIDNWTEEKQEEDDEEGSGRISQWFGAASPYFIFSLKFICPIIGMILIFFSVLREYPYMGNADKYPMFFDIFGWIISLSPLFALFLVMIRNFLFFKKNGYDLRGLFMLQKQHVSYSRIVEAYDEDKFKLQEILPSQEPWHMDLFSESDNEA